MVLTPLQTRRIPAGPTDSEHRPMLFPVLAILVTGFAAPLAAMEWDFEPRVSLGQVWTDNVTLETSSQKESEWITELRPGFTITGEGARAQAALDYELQALWFADNSDLNDVYNQLSGTASVEILPENLFVDAFARYDQQEVDTTGRLAYNNFFETDNRTDYLVFGLSPYHVGRYGAWGESLLRYQYLRLRFSNTDPGVEPPDDSDTNSVTFSIGSPLAARGYSWRASARVTKTDFERNEDFEYARTDLDLGIPLGARIRLVGTIGQESDVEEAVSGGGLDETLWLVGFIWAPSDLQSLEVRGGDRFFGNTWEAHWTRRGSRGELSVDYTENPTTSAGVLGDDDLFVPGFPTSDIGTLDSRVFLHKRLSGAARYQLARSALLVRLYSDRREYFDASGDEEDSYGATLGYEWDLAARTQLGAIVDWEKRKFEDSREDDYGELGLRVTRELNRTLTGELRLSHFVRNSNVEDDYNANLIALYVQATF